MGAGMDDLFGDVISSYFPEDGIKDGVLIDTESVEAGMARQCGYLFPVYLTKAVKADLDRIPASQDIKGRLWDMLWMGKPAARYTARTQRSSTYRFVMQVGRKKMYTPKITLQGHADGSPCFIFSQPQED